ncbi:DUF6603 domain-containing protein [Corallococcus macrosporus]|uniref:DUF6603 domain-containing protein n=1 Tax=Corallococcus macrosporus DSM 14697 TaxID=1189310 RepID=A0A250JLD8_9BACT|nr:DUF6603 domain-containing protein [Corallococcus macrosporus]ATB44685.1 hypothetical protein MYMAC_000256 [Corallococcus macrosporus DSM 14697]
MATFQIKSLKDLTKKEALAALQGDGVEFPFTTKDGPTTLLLKATKPDEAGTLPVSADCTGLTLARVADLGQLVTGVDFDVLRGVPLSDALGLQRIALVIDTKQQQLTSLTVSLQSQAPWELVPGLFTLKKLNASFELSSPFDASRKLSCTLSELLDFKGLALDGKQQLPSLRATADLPANETPDLGQLLARVLPDAPLSSLPTLTLDTLHVEADPASKSYSLEGHLKGSWSFLDKVITLNDLKLDLSGTGTDMPDGGIQADLTLAGVPLKGAVRLPRGGSSWRFTGQPASSSSGSSKPKLDADALFQELSHLFQTQLPTFQKRLVVEALKTVADLRQPHTVSLAFGVDGAGTLAFDLNLQHDRFGKTVLSSFQAADSASRDLKDLLGGVSPDLAQAVPAGMTVQLTDAHFAAVQPQGPYKLLFGVDLGGGLNLAKLPLVGGFIPAGQEVRLAYQVQAASQAFDEDDMKALAELFTQQKVTLLPSPVAQGLSFHGTLTLGDKKLSLDLPVKLDKDTGQVVPDEGGPSTFASTAGAVKWFQTQKAFGPIHIERVGLKYADKQVEVLLDASMSVAGLSLGLSGMGVSSPLTALSPTFHLDGLSLDFSQGPVEIGGALLRKEVTDNEGTYDTYNGAAAVALRLQDTSLALQAIGAYADYHGAPSLFLYASLEVPLGGPPFLEVKGISAGFGFNRSLTIPAVDQIATFPLVEQVIKGDLPDVGKTKDQAGLLLQQLDSLSTYIQPRAGAGFIAVGLKFSSFEMLNCFALLTVELGDRFEVDLLGVADLVVPKDVPGEKRVDPLAEVQLLLEARVAPEEGFVGVIAELAPSSYVLSRACHLTGGFALYTWFAGAHAGDFVVTLGGYHPRFPVPSHYPQVPRLGLNWRIDGNTLLKGDGYFALCSHALMAGGHAELSYHKGSVHASIKANVDFLMSWKPFAYDLQLGLDVRASVGILGPVDVNVDVHLWGPDFGGKARIHVVCVHITVAFGDSASRGPQALDWSGFQQSFLPPKEEDRTSITLSSGLSRQVDFEGQPLWVVNPKQFELATGAFFPSKQAFAGSTSLDTDGAFRDFGVRTMAVPADDLQTTQRITITREEVSVEDAFQFAPLQKKAPASLWGAPDTVPNKPDQLRPPRPDEPRFTADPSTGKNPLSGYRIQPTKPPAARETAAIPTRMLRYETEQVPDAYAWSGVPAFQPGVNGDAESRTAITQTLASNTRRNQLLEALGFQPDRDVQLDASGVAQSFVIAPQVQ